MLSEKKFNMVKDALNVMKKSGWQTYKMVACVHELWREYIISGDQAEELYWIADPEEKYNDTAEYYSEMDYKNPLMEVLK